MICINQEDQDWARHVKQEDQGWVDHVKQEDQDWADHVKQKERSWEEQKKLHAARFAWRRRTQRTPKGVKWDAWFEKMFGENLYEYAERMAKKNEI